MANCLSRLSSSACVAVLHLVIACLPAVAQVGEEIATGSACSYLGDPLPNSLHQFESSEEALAVVKAIVEATGLPQNFQIVAAGVPNAAASIRGERRLILYNPNFMREVRRRCSENRWAAISIMAHEIGHHLSGHTLGHAGSRPKEELEADLFSGFILQKMGASIDDAQIAMREIGSPVASATHPAKGERLVAISSGWEKSCKGDAKCSGLDPNPVPAPKTKPSKSGAKDSCQYAKDGECDEPDTCKPGTDSTDCAKDSEDTDDSGDGQSSKASQLPSFCCTSVGRLGPYPNPGIPVGASCYGTHPLYGVQYGRACF